ncbi:MAG: prepilin-type N-terminal cleavage/methylation domain-containing protein [Planctomycetes bacterium]|nr:prepilin-type N-terminal cleavage/methylation domain-containing protein [Planctomycetota bacterium]
MKPRAFTLLELMVVMVVGTAVVGPAVVIFLETVRSTDLFVEACDMGAAAECAFGRLAADVHSASALRCGEGGTGDTLAMELDGGTTVTWQFAAGDEDGFRPASLTRRFGEDTERFVLPDVERVVFARDESAAATTSCAVAVEVHVAACEDGSVRLPATVLCRVYDSRIERPASEGGAP